MKTLNTTRNLLAALLLTCAAALNALGQIEQAPVTPKIDPEVPRWLASIANAPNGCVFEGEVLRSYAYEDEIKRFYSYEVKVTNVFKGNLKPGTIQVMKSFYKDLTLVSHYSRQVPKNGILYAKLRSDYHPSIPPPDSAWTTFDNQLLIASWVLFEFREQWPKVAIDLERIGNAGFSTRNEFFEWFKAQDYVTVPSGYDVNRLSDGKELRPVNYPPIDHEAEKREREEFERKFKEEKRKWGQSDPHHLYRNLPDSLKRKWNHNMTKEQFDSACKVNPKFEQLRRMMYRTGDAGVKKTSTLDATASIGNIHLQYNDWTERWEIQAQIGLSVSQGLYLDTWGFFLYYNSQVFGVNVHGNDKFGLTKIGKISPTGYPTGYPYTIDVLEDEYTDTLSIAVGTPYSNELPSNEKRIWLEPNTVHYLFDISFALDTSYADCDSFINLGIHNSGILYSDSSQNKAIFSQAVDFGGPITRKACRPVITQIDPVVTSGTQNSFLIKGYNFGPITSDLYSRGNNIGVRLLSADHDTASYVNKDFKTDFPDHFYNNQTLKAWTDSLIRMELRMYTDLVSSSLVARAPATGPVVVTNSLGFANYNPPTLTIPYGVINIINGNPNNNDEAKKRVLHLAGINKGQGYDVYLHQNIANNAQAVAAIKMAMKRWQCKNSMNWRLAGVVDGFSTTNDTCVIGFAAFVDSSTLAQVTPKVLLCSQGFDTAPSRKFNMYINDAVSWNYNLTVSQSSGSTDFYEVLLHELGHAQLLHHVKDQNDIMYFTNKPLGGPRFLFPDRSNSNAVDGTKFAVGYGSRHVPSGCDTLADGRSLRSLVPVYEKCSQAAAMTLDTPMRFQCEYPDVIRAKPPTNGGIPPFWYIWEPQMGNQVTLSDLFSANPVIIAFNPLGTAVFSYKLIVIDNSDPPNIDSVSYYQIITPEIAESFYSFDLWAQDDALDIGHEPNNESVNIWYSPDLWNQNLSSSSNPREGRAHEEPKADVQNYLHVQFYNRGCRTYDSTANAYAARLYWCFANSGEKWKSDWMGLDSSFFGRPAGGHLGDIPIPTLAPGDSARRYLPYCPIDCNPVPEDSSFDYSNFICFLNRMVDTTRINEGLWQPEVEGPNSTRINVTNFNQLVTRNTGLVKGTGKTNLSIGPLGFHLRNSLATSANLTLRWTFDPLHSDYAYPITHYGTIYIQLAPALDSAWRAAGASGTGIQISTDPDDRWIRLTDPFSAFISGLPLHAGTFSPIRVRFDSDSLASEDSEAIYSFFVQQYQSPIGTVDLGMHPDAYAGGVNLGFHLVHGDTSGGDKTTPNRMPQQQARTELLPPRPNPTSGSVAFDFRLAQPESQVRLELIDLHGRVVSLLWSGPAPAGPHSVAWDSTPLPTGLYSVRLVAGGRILSRRLAVVR